MSEFVSEPQDGEAQESPDRRQFLSKSGLMLALLALAQGGDAAEAASEMSRGGAVAIPASELRTLNLTLNAALGSGKVDPKSAAFLKLSPAVQKAFLTLTPSELNTLRQAQMIFQNHFNPAQAGDNNGTIGM